MVPEAQVEIHLGYSPDGLSKAEATTRLAQYGPNEIEEHKTNPLLKFLSYFWGPIPWMIEIAVILSGAVGHWPDFFIILLLLVANGVVGYTEERQAGNAIEALKAKLAINAGYDVVLSNSRGPETLEGLCAELGPRARAAHGAECAEAADLVVVAVPVKAYLGLPAAS